MLEIEVNKIQRSLGWISLAFQAMNHQAELVFLAAGETNPSHGVRILILEPISYLDCCTIRTWEITAIAILELAECITNLLLLQIFIGTYTGNYLLQYALCIN